MKIFCFFSFFSINPCVIYKSLLSLYCQNDKRWKQEN
nr:MAG TPA: hypothetical protein [Caudoviricetes sp.]